MRKQTDIRVESAEVYFLPVKTRVPLKFGTETLTEVICARVRVTVADRAGRLSEGWGETPLSVQWAWPATLPYTQRSSLMQQFCTGLAEAMVGFENQGHPIELSHDFQEHQLPALAVSFHKNQLPSAEPIPRLAMLVCYSPFDLALHDAFGNSLARPVYQTYTAEYMNRSLADFLAPAAPGIAFSGKYPAEFLVPTPAKQLPAWHLVGGLDPLDESELTGSEPNDDYPVLLKDWILRDGLNCLKIKLRGNNSEWDFQRLAKVGTIGLKHRVEWLSADFNCTVRDPDYVNHVLDRFKAEFPQLHDQLLYVEQPFPYELQDHPIPVHSVSARKPLFLDESAHDWKVVRLGRELGWTGVALKTCKTQTGALLAGCWAKAHGMSIMVQDLTNPMLAQIPHLLLASHIGTIMGVETNAMQFYPDASSCEATVHPGLYRRSSGKVNLGSISGPGFGYRLAEIQRQLPPPVARVSR